MDFSGIEVTIFDDYYVVGNKGEYFKLGVREGRLVNRLKNGYSKEEIIEGEDISETDFVYVIEELKKNNVIGEKKKEKKNILFFKIPLFSADNLMIKCNAVLEKHKIFDMKVFALMNAVIAIGLILMLINYKNIFRIDSIKLPGIQYGLLYIISLVIICLHEFAHGLTCKHYGGKVGTMGIIFILFSPALYCDISGVRMFKEKRRQIFSSLAGIYLNTLVIALISIICLWFPLNFLKALIILNSMTVVTNIIPFIRLDGYWVLSFATGITNLYRKSIKIIFQRGSNKIKSKTDWFLLIYGLVTMVIVVISILCAFIEIFRMVYNWIH